MGQLSSKLRGGYKVHEILANGWPLWEGHLSWWCPGCEEVHAVSDRWQFNGDLDEPTFAPSVKVTYRHPVPPVTPENLEEWRRSPWPQTKVDDICHVFIVGGVIDFLPDCTHHLAGQKVAMPDLPEWLQDPPIGPASHPAQLAPMPPVSPQEPRSSPGLAATRRNRFRTRCPILPRSCP